MNRTEKIICLLLGGLLAWYIFNEAGRAKEAARAQAEAAEAQAAVAAQAEPAAASNRVEAAMSATSEAESQDPKEPAVPAEPERLVTLENDDVKLELSTWGAVVKKVTLKSFARDCGPGSDENPPVELDFSAAAKFRDETWALEQYLKVWKD